MKKKPALFAIPYLTFVSASDDLTDEEKRECKLYRAKVFFGTYTLCEYKESGVAEWHLISPLVSPETDNQGSFTRFENMQKAVASAQSHYERWMKQDLKEVNNA